MNKDDIYVKGLQTSTRQCLETPIYLSRTLKSIGLSWKYCYFTRKISLGETWWMLHKKRILTNVKCKSKSNFSTSIVSAFPNGSCHYLWLNDKTCNLLRKGLPAPISTQEFFLLCRNLKKVIIVIKKSISNTQTGMQYIPSTIYLTKFSCQTRSKLQLNVTKFGHFSLNLTEMVVYSVNRPKTSLITTLDTSPIYQKL